MAKIRCNVMLDEDLVLWIRKAAGNAETGSIPVGLRVLKDRFDTGQHNTTQTHHKPKERTFDLPDDALPTEKVDGRVAAGIALRAKKEADAAKENLAKYSAVWADRCLSHFIGTWPEGHLAKDRDIYSKHLTQEEMDTIYNEVMADDDDGDPWLEGYQNLGKEA